MCSCVALLQTWCRLCPNEELSGGNCTPEALKRSDGKKCAKLSTFGGVESSEAIALALECIPFLLGFWPVWLAKSCLGLWSEKMQALNVDKVAALALNTQALGVQQNLDRILQAVQEAVAEGKSALFGAELCVTGVECDDMFLNEGFIAKVQKLVREFQEKLPLDFVVGLGLPQLMSAQCFADPAAFAAAVDPEYAAMATAEASAAVEVESDGEELEIEVDETEKNAQLSQVTGPLASSYVLLTRDQVLFTAPSKLQLSHGLTDYSERYFAAAYDFPGFDLVQGYVAQVGEKKILVAFGDHEFFVAPQIQEYVAAHHDEFAFILMSAAYGYEVGKPQDAEQEAILLSQIYNLPVVRVNNVGCEAGGTLYDGQCLFVKDGEVNARSPLFSFKDYAITYTTSGVQPALTQYDEMLKAVAIGLQDWLKKTYSCGYALSLSGGADSALCATCVALSQVYALLDLGVDAYVAQLQKLKVELDYEAFKQAVEQVAGKGPYGSDVNADKIEQVIECLKQHVIPKLLVCAYQGSDYSGSVTLTAATKMAECLGATFYQWSISQVVKDYVSTINGALGYELSWEHDDIALQNIQARSRLPSIWLLANHKGFLLIATSNLSEAAVGYCTMDGDTAGGLSPIAGIDKSTILKINSHIMHHGIGLDGFEQKFKVPAMSYIVAQAPTAELRPGGEQTDEKDLMPYPLLDTIRQLFTCDNLLPEEIIATLKVGKEEQYRSVTLDLGVSTDEDIERCVRRFFALFQRNQWKRERYATGFHIEKDDASPKSYLRFPVLSASLCS